MIVHNLWSAKAVRPGEGSVIGPFTNSTDKETYGFLTLASNEASSFIVYGEKEFLVKPIRSSPFVTSSPRRHPYCRQVIHTSNLWKGLTLPLIGCCV